MFVCVCVGGGGGGGKGEGGQGILFSCLYVRQSHFGHSMGYLIATAY